MRGAGSPVDVIIADFGWGAVLVIGIDAINLYLSYG